MGIQWPEWHVQPDPKGDAAKDAHQQLYLRCMPQIRLAQASIGVRERAAKDGALIRYPCANLSYSANF